MKKFHLFFMVLFILPAVVLAQGNKPAANDSTVHFKVLGTCEMCKNRIENVSKGKGVRSASWDVDTKMLTLVFNPAQTNQDKIENRIVAAGHDLETKKAKDKTYEALPACCHFREFENMRHDDPEENAAAQLDTALEIVKRTTANEQVDGENQVVKGIVLEANKQGTFTPLSGASVLWLNSGKGVSTDSNGVFTIEHTAMEDQLVISYSGYKPDTVSVTDINEVKIFLGTNQELSEVTVTSKRRTTFISANPIRTQVMTEKELFKAACCNLSESFETNPSVDVSYNDAVTGSKQIQLLGLSGNYTQLTVENLPGPRGIATPLGLNSIAGPWVESIQLTKGIGSVVNGYESIAGQINVELKKPENSEQLFANIYLNDFGKTDLNLNLAKTISPKWSTGLLLHDDFLTNKNIDFNKDGFRDLPTGNQFSLINRWKYDDGLGFMTQFGVKVLNDRKTGGEVKYDASKDKNTTNSYGLGINTDRYEVFSKIGYVFPEKQFKSIGLQLSAFNHDHESYFGLTTYNATQQNFYANLIYQSIINNTKHTFRTGLSFLFDKYDEDFNALNFKRTEKVPGAFFEYTYTASEKLSVITGLRADHNSLFGFFATPRVHIKYEPVKGSTFRVSAGRGQRTANIFAENSSIFVSARQVNLPIAQPGKAYGLDAESAWNKGISFDQKFRLFQKDGMISLDFFRNDFENQVVVDLENPREVNFYNLDGKSFSNSLQAELSVEPLDKLEMRLAYRYFDVKTNYGSKLLTRPLIAAHRAFVNAAYTAGSWKFDYTANASGKKRIPGTTTNPAPHQRPESSPAFVLMNAQVSKTVGKKYPMDFYLGAENIGNYFQKDVIVAPGQPFGDYFDASLVWGPVTGRMFYVGWRYKIR